MQRILVSNARVDRVEASALSGRMVHERDILAISGLCTA